MPGTVRQDSRGVMHGTGRWLYHYKTGTVKLDEYYVAGCLTQSRWFRPDGSLFAETHWQDGNGIGYGLREDGTLRVRMEYQHELAHGQAVYYKDDGKTIERVAEFREGIEIRETD